MYADNTVIYVFSGWVISSISQNCQTLYSIWGWSQNTSRITVRAILRGNRNQLIFNAYRWHWNTLGLITSPFLIQLNYLHIILAEYAWFFVITKWLLACEVFVAMCTYINYGTTRTSQHGSKSGNGNSDKNMACKIARYYILIKVRWKPEISLTLDRRKKYYLQSTHASSEIRPLVCIGLERAFFMNRPVWCTYRSDIVALWRDRSISCSVLFVCLRVSCKLVQFCNNFHVA